VHGGSSASWAGNLPFWGTLLTKKPEIGYVRVCNSYRGLDGALANLSSALATRRIGMCG